jgi:hypothetical protein
MRSATRGVAVTIIGLGVAVLAAAAPAAGATCGDANRTGTVTVTDGVLVLRAAAELPATVCPKERCDMNLDDRVTVTDGVLALRVAAGIQTSVACSSTQVDTIFGTIQKTIGRGGGQASASARARAANTTTPCSGGGSQTDDGVTLTFDNCQEDDLVTNGTITFTAVDTDVVDVSFATSDFTPSTGETLDTSGTLHFTFFDDGTTQVDGTLSYASSIFGTYDTAFSEVQLDADFVTFSGEILTTVVDGRDAFANLSALEITMYSPTLSEIGVTYADGSFDLFVDGEGLCEPCTSTCDNPSLTCVSCGDECSGDTDRCGIDFNFVDCDDGVFGPANLCEPCNSNADCDASDGLSCFSCGENCTGSVMRCSSSKAFAECEDGEF